MKNVEVAKLEIPAIKIIRYERFRDKRGYFTETFKQADFEKIYGQTGKWKMVQANESFSIRNTVRGLHFQWNPYMGKLVRTIRGHMIDLVLDIRMGSPWFGKIIACDMPANSDMESNEWIWVPPGFAHGNMFLEDTVIEYFCSGEYSSGNEACISPLSKDIDWSICDKSIKKIFEGLVSEEKMIITDKDKNGLSINEWIAKDEAHEFEYTILEETKEWNN